MNADLDQPVICSAKQCQAPAAFELRWNNPKVHTPERLKVWLACDEHRHSLSEFLAARNFLREVAPYEATGPEAGQPPIADIGRVG